jgi:hypothetical protein
MPVWNASADCVTAVRNSGTVLSSVLPDFSLCIPAQLQKLVRTKLSVFEIVNVKLCFDNSVILTAAAPASVRFHCGTSDPANIQRLRHYT